MVRVWNVIELSMHVQLVYNVSLDESWINWMFWQEVELLEKKNG